MKNPNYQKFLSGTLKNEGKGISIFFSVAIKNTTKVPISLIQVISAGNYQEFSVIQPGDTFNTPIMWRDGDYCGVRCKLTGAFMAVISIYNTSTPFVISADLICSPNDIGIIPEATKSVPIPVDTPNVLVACGILPNGNFVTREQYWSLQPDSYCLAPGEDRTVSYTEVTGMQQTSSIQTTVESAIGATASAGWGPISASISASLSMSSMTNQQIAVSSESTAYSSVKMNNTTKTPQMVLRWQLMDVLTIISKTTKLPIATIETGQSPTLVKIYPDTNNLPATESVRSLSPITKSPDLPKVIKRKK